MSAVFTILWSPPLQYVWGVLFGVLILWLIARYPRIKQATQAGYLAYLEVEQLAKQYNWKGFEKSKPFREALDFILRDQFGIEAPTPQDIAVATKAMEKAVINEKKEGL